MVIYGRLTQALGSFDSAGLRELTADLGSNFFSRTTTDAAQSERFIALHFISL